MRRLALRAFCTLGILVMAPVALALDPERTIHQYTMRSWSLEEGFPQTSANGIVQSPDGYIYVATFGGLIRFDGVRVTVVPNDGSCSNRLFSIEIDSDERVWVGTERSGLCRIENGVLKAYLAPDGIEIGGVSAIRPARTGGLWIGSVNGLIRIRDDRLERFGPEAGLPDPFVASLDEGPGEALWVGTPGGVCLFRDGRCEVPEWNDAFGGDAIVVVRRGSGGELWVGTSAAVYRVSGGRPEKVEPPDGRARVRCVLEDRDGNVWLGLDPGGLRRITPRYEELTRDVGLVSDMVTAMLEDREGNLWVGFSGSGLVKLSDGRAIGFHLPSDELSVPVLPIVSDGRGGIWAGTACEGLAHVTADGIRMVAGGSGLANLCVWSLLPASDGGLWIGTHGDGLFRMSPDTEVVPRDGLQTREKVVRALTHDERGGILVGTDQGLYRHDVEDGGYTLVEGTRGEDVYYVDQAEDGSIWIGTRRGAVVIRESGIERIDRAAGLSNDHVRAILRDPDGVVWLGTYGGGLHRYQNGRITVYDTSNGLRDSVVSRILEDSFGRFWMTGNRGVTRVERRQLEELASGQRTTVSSELFDIFDGMPVSETNGGGQPAGLILSDGTLYVPTVDGVAVFDTGRDISNPLPPPVHIEEVQVDGKPIDLSSSVVLPSNARNLEIHYTALSFRSPERVRFRYRLEGYDERWIDAGGRRVAYYPVIPSGALTFHVMGSNDDGVWNEEGARFEFRMTPRFIETPAFMVLSVVGVGLLFLLAMWLRGIALASHRRTLEREVEVRTVELAKLAELTEHINQAMTLEEVLDKMYDSLHPLVPYDRIGLALLDDNRVILRAIWSRGASDTTGIGEGYEAPLEGSSLLRILESGEPRVIPDLERYLAEHPDSESTRKILSEGIRSNMTCPLKARGRPVGFLFFSSSVPDTYGPSHVRFLQQIAGHLSIVVGKTKLYEDLLETKGRLEEANRHLESLAAADGLTGIANRRTFDLRFQEEWRRSIRAGTPLSLLMIDVDFFKAYNDEYGHTVGDDCLRTIATVLVANLRRVADLVARFGGEEFAVILPDTDEASAIMMADRLRGGVEVLRMEHTASTVAGFVTISVGGSTVTPVQERPPSLLVEAADAALYEAKRAGRNRAIHRALEVSEPG